MQGGFAPDLADVSEALELVMAAIKASGHSGAISIALDVAASELAVRLATCPALFVRACARACATGPCGRAARRSYRASLPVLHAALASGVLCMILWRCGAGQRC